MYIVHRPLNCATTVCQDDIKLIKLDLVLLAKRLGLFFSVFQIPLSIDMKALPLKNMEF